MAVSSVSFKRIRQDSVFCGRNEENGMRRLYMAARLRLFAAAFIILNFLTIITALTWGGKELGTGSLL